MNIIPTAPIRYPVRSGSYKITWPNQMSCDWRDKFYVFGSNGTNLSGEVFLSPSEALKGNHVDALPYWTKKLEYQAPSGSVKFLFSKKIIRTSGSPAYLAANVCDGATVNERAELSVNAEDIPWSRIVAIPALTKDINSPIASHADINFARVMAETKAKNSLRRGLTNLPMMFAERAQTMKTIQTKSNAIIDVIKNRHKADFSRWTRIKGSRNKKLFAKRAAADHLELIFGILPLINDLQGLAEYATLPETTFVKGKGKHAAFQRETVVKRHNSRMPGEDYFYLNGSSVTHFDLLHSFIVSLRADVTSQLGTKSQQLGFSPLYNLYDAVPLSFVLSWFSNFGHWIGSLDPLIGAEFRTGSVSHLSRETVRTEFHGEDIQPYSELPGATDVTQTFTQCRGSLEYVCRKTHTTRTVLTSEPDSDFLFYNNMSLFSVGASISLAIQRKLKIPKRMMVNSPFKYKGRKTVKNLPPIKYVRVHNASTNRS